MPHATNPSDSRDAQDVQDDLLIQQALGLDPQNALDFNRELEPGEKADNAVDYGDLSDDDLADEEEAASTNDPVSQQQGLLDESLGDFGNGNGHQVTDEPGGFGDDIDDLFGDVPQSPVEDGERAHKNSAGSLLPELESFDSGLTDTQDGHHKGLFEKSLVNGHKTETNQPSSLQVLNAQTVSKEEQMQQYLISMSTQSAATQDSLLHAPQETEHIQDLATLWPKFERDSVPRFMDMLPQKQSRYVGHRPLKQPKPVYPTKLNLDLAQDQEKQFRLPSAPRRKTDADDERHNIIRISTVQASDDDGHEDVDLLSDSGNETVGGVTWQDLQIACEDWDYESPAASSEAVSQHSHRDDDADHVVSTDDLWDMPPAKVSD